MSGAIALDGKWEHVVAQYFDITEDMIMEFEVKACNMQNSDGILVETTERGYFEREAHTSYWCIIIKARIRFRKKMS